MATETTKLTYIEGAAASTPASTRVVTYAKADGLMYSKDDAGTETLMSGGSGSGIPATILDAKGDLIAASAADTAARLATAANGAALITASGETTGLKWRLNNDAASAAPTVNDDSGDGYAIGSRWLDTTADKEYVATDVTVGAAVWKETTAAGGGGALVLLEQHTASSSATLDFTTCISSTYDEYLIELVNVIPATDATTLRFQVSTDGGSSYDATAGRYQWTAYISAAGAAGANGSGSDTAISLINGGELSNTTSEGGLAGSMRLFSPGSASINKFVTAQVVHIRAGGGLATWQTSGLYTQTTAVDEFRVLMASGNIASGTIRVYGIAKS